MRCGSRPIAVPALRGCRPRREVGLAPGQTLGTANGPGACPTMARGGGAEADSSINADSPKYSKRLKNN